MDVHLNLLNAKIGRPLRPFNVPVPLEVFAEVKLPELLLLLFLRGHNLLKLILVVHIKHTVFQQALQCFGNDGSLAVPESCIVIKELE